MQKSQPGPFLRRICWKRQKVGEGLAKKENPENVRKGGDSAKTRKYEKTENVGKWRQLLHYGKTERMPLERHLEKLSPFGVVNRCPQNPKQARCSAFISFS